MEEELLQNLIAKYVQGTASDAEREELLSWYRTKNENSLWPYKNSREEHKAKSRMLKNLQQQIKNQPDLKRFVIPLYYQIAAAVAIIIGSVIFYRLNDHKQRLNTLALNTINTKAGEHKIIKLSDGSIVWLSAKSSLAYPISFTKSTRDISFEGEAFFQIAKDKKHPFIVHTGLTSTRVLGTTFNIKALKNNPEITVALITGKVAFASGSSQVKLVPGQQLICNKVTSIVKLEQIPNTADIVNRHNGDYEYKGMSVANVLEDVNLNFNTNYQIAGKVKDCLFYGRLKPGENTLDFLKKMAMIENAQVIKINNIYMIKGGGCD